MTAESSHFSPAASGRTVLRSARTGALATLDAGGNPHSSFVTVATAFSGAPLFLLSRLALHTRNLLGDSRASLLLVAPGGETGDPLAGARLSLSGRIAPDAAPASRARFLARHAEAAGYAGFADFAIYRMIVESGHLVAGFGRIATLAGQDLIDRDDNPALEAAEAGALAHMNADHREALRLYATRLCAMPDGDWRATGCDPEGIDLRAGPLGARLAFPGRVTSAGELRTVLAGLARKARAETV